MAMRHANKEPGAEGNTESEFELPALAPFSLERTVAALRRRTLSLTDVFEDGEYQRVVTLDGVPRSGSSESFRGGPRLLAVRQRAPDAVRVRALDGPLSAAERRSAAIVLDRMLGLRFDLTPIARAVNCDERLARLMAQVPGLKPPRFDTLWTTLLCVVPFQQVSLDAGQAILNRVVSAFGALHAYPGGAVYAFPSAERIANADPELLRQCGLSRSKVQTLRSAAVRIVDGTLREEDIADLEDEAAEQRLRLLPGIGPWSAHIILLRGFGRLGLFPPGDSGASGTLAKLFELDAKQAEAHTRALCEALGPWKGYLYFLLLAWRLLQAGILAPAPALPDS